MKDKYVGGRDTLLQNITAHVLFCLETKPCQDVNQIISNVYTTKL